MEYDIIYTAYITLRNGRKLWAKDCGKKCFCFKVPRKKEGDK